MKAVVKKKRPFLLQKHRKERMDFAIRHKDWTLEDWKRVVWSDETKIKCLGSDGRKWAWKRVGEGPSDRLVKGTVKFGHRSVMLWGCMLWDGPEYACRIDGSVKLSRSLSDCQDPHLIAKILSDPRLIPYFYCNMSVFYLIWKILNILYFVGNGAGCMHVYMGEALVFVHAGCD